MKLEDIAPNGILVVGNEVYITQRTFTEKVESLALGLVTEIDTGFRYIGQSPNREQNAVSSITGLPLSEANCKFDSLQYIEFTREHPVKDSSGTYYMIDSDTNRWEDVNYNGNYLIPKE